MDYKIELIIIPVTDVDRAKAFYVDQVGFHADPTSRSTSTLRFVQLTPPGSACSIAFGQGLTDAEPGSVSGMQLVIADADQAHAELLERGVPVSDVHDQPGAGSSSSPIPTATAGRCSSFRSAEPGVAASRTARARWRVRLPAAPGGREQ